MTITADLAHDGNRTTITGYTLRHCIGDTCMCSWPGKPSRGGDFTDGGLDSQAKKHLDGCTKRTP